MSSQFTCRCPIPVARGPPRCHDRYNHRYSHSTSVSLVYNGCIQRDRLQSQTYSLEKHEDVIPWKHFPYYWSFVWGYHRWPKEWTFLHNKFIVWIKRFIDNGIPDNHSSFISFSPLEQTQKVGCLASLKVFHCQPSSDQNSRRPYPPSSTKSRNSALVTR